MGEQTTSIRPPDQISRDIDSTRRRIEQRAGALRDRVSPRELVRPLTDRLKETLGEGGEKILDVFRENPIPLALVGVGLGWLLLKDTGRGKATEPGLRIKEAAQHAGESASHAASAVSGRIESLAHRATEAAKRRATSTADWFSTTLDQNPLAVAVGALALGMVAGIVIPATEKEEDTVGKLGEQVAEAALDKSAAIVQPAPEAQQASASREGRAESEGAEGMGE